VGIGTSSPSSKLHLYKTGTSDNTLTIQNGQDAYASVLDLRANNDGGAIYNSLTSTTNGGTQHWKIWGGAASSTMAFSTGATERMRIDASGRVGIGTSSPTAKFHVYGGNSGSGVDVATFRSASGAFNIKCSDLSAANPTWTLRTFSGEPLAFGQGTDERMRIDASGNLLVGTTVADGIKGLSIKPSTYATSLIFNAAATSNFLMYFRYYGTNVGTISTTNTATTYSTSSDQRLKDNIADADDAGSKIDSIQVRKYDWKADGSHQDYGMVAQELQAVAPEAVSGDADSEEMMGVDYSKLVPMLIKEIQSLRNRVAQLETGE